MANPQNRLTGSEVVGNQTTTEEVHNIDATDDFDPFSDVVECLEENIDIALSAPPENQ